MANIIYGDAPLFRAGTQATKIATASRLLQESDWVNQPDVSDTSLTPHLTNKAEFDAYRLALRQIAVSPTEGDLEWPVKPHAVWNV